MLSSVEITPPLPVDCKGQARRPRSGTVNPLNNLDIEQCCQDACQAARLAWDAIRGYYKGSFKVIQKAGEGPATEADLLADRVILDHLSARYPASAFGFLSEETEKGSERLNKPWCWIVDPIDGTRDFIEGKPDFAVHIGLAGNMDGVEGGLTPAVGVVYLPVENLLFRATRGGGAWVDRLDLGTTDRVRVSTQDTMQEMELVVTRSNWGRRMYSAVEQLSPKRVYRRGSLGVKVCDVALGRADAYLNTARGQCKEWDTCAPHAVLLEAGGKLSDLNGAPIRYNKPDYIIENGILASNGTLHQPVLEELHQTKELWDQF